MTSVSSSNTATGRSAPQWAEFLRIRELWGSLAITMMWVAVSLDAVWGPDFVSSNGSGTQTTTIPSAVFVAFFACLASASVAKRAFR